MVPVGLALVVIVVYASCLYPNHTRHHRHLLFHQVTPFNTIHAAFLQRRFAMDPVTAAQIIGIPDTISMILTPFTGSFVDRFGKRVYVGWECLRLISATVIGWLPHAHNFAH